MQIVQSVHVEHLRPVPFRPDPSHPDSNWSQDRVELLKKLWSDGWSGAQIALYLGGVSRCAVLGKVHRMHLPKRQRPIVGQRSPRVRTARKPRDQHMKPCRPPQTLVALAPARAQREDAVPPALRIDLLDLRDGMCRWPIGDPKEESFHFCGHQKADDISYCNCHALIAFKPTQRKGGWK